MAEPSASTTPAIGKQILRSATRDKREGTSQQVPLQELEEPTINERIQKLEAIVLEQAAATQTAQDASQTTNQLLQQLIAAQQASPKVPSRQSSCHNLRPRQTIENTGQGLDSQDVTPPDPSDSSDNSAAEDSGPEGPVVSNYRSRGGRHRVQTLSDGETKGPTIDAYILQVKGEFVRNASDYSSLQLRLLFLVETTENPAQRILMARMKEGSTQKFKSVNEAFSALRIGLGKVHDPAEAEEIYRRLKMPEDGLYSTFITDFLLLSADANIEPSVFRRDLWIKISDKLQLKMGPTKHLYKTFTKLSNALQSADNEDRWTRERMSITKPPRQSEAKKYNTSSDSLATSSSRTKGGRARSSHSPPTSVPQLPVRQRAQTPTAEVPHIQCFNCDKYGHYARDCTQPKRSVAEIKEIYGADWEPENEYIYSENE